MTNKEAIKYLIAPRATSTEPSAEYLKQKEAYELAIKALEIQDNRQYSEEHTMFDDCYPCTNCQEFECDGCAYDLMHKGNQK